VFEDKNLADQAVMAVEKAVHHEDMDAKAVELGEVQQVEKASSNVAAHSVNL
jgi:hypothetical protein